MKINSVVLFSIRTINTDSVIFKGFEPEECQPLIEYLASLSDDLANEIKQFESGAQDSSTLPNAGFPFDELKENVLRQLKEQKQASINDLIQSIGQANNLISLGLEKDMFLLSTPKDQIPTSILEILNQIKPSEDSSGEIKSIKITPISPQWNELIKVSTTHCDKQDALWKHRLGWYCKEDESHQCAVCAVYPWEGKGAEDHNEKWKELLVKAVIQKYEGVQRLILVCHDRDFIGFEGRDEIVSLNINNGGSNYKKGVEIPLVVFMHNNPFITGAFKKTSVKEIYDSINDYVSGYSKLRSADKDALNAKSHDKKRLNENRS